MSDVREIVPPEQERERMELDRAFRDVIALQAGKRVIFWLLSECAIYADAFTGEDAPTNYRLGQQSAGRKLIAKLDELDARYYPKLLLEMAEIREMDRAASRLATEQGDDDEIAP